MRVSSWIKSLVLASIVAAGPASRVAAQQLGVPFPSPDGTRVVRLSLTRLTGQKGTPSLLIEYSMQRSVSQVLIRPFTSPCAGSESARYRVAWDEGSRRFAVLGTEATGRGAAKLAKPPSGEYVLCTHDRATVRAARASELETDAWGIAKWKSADAVGLPLRELDIRRPSSEYAGRTGIVVNGIARDRVQNLTTHSNTQNFAPGRLAVTPTIEVIASQRAPERHCEARLAHTDFPTESQKILHAETLRAFNHLVQHRRQRVDSV